MTAFFVRWPSGQQVRFRALTWAEFRQFDYRLKHEPPELVYWD